MKQCQVCSNPGVGEFQVCSSCGWKNDPFLVDPDDDKYIGTAGDTLTEKEWVFISYNNGAGGGVSPNSWRIHAGVRYPFDPKPIPSDGEPIQMWVLIFECPCPDDYYRNYEEIIGVFLTQAAAETQAENLELKYRDSWRYKFKVREMKTGEVNTKTLP